MDEGLDVGTRYVFIRFPILLHSSVHKLGNLIATLLKTAGLDGRQDCSGDEKRWWGQATEGGFWPPPPSPPLSRISTMEDDKAGKQQAPRAILYRHTRSFVL